MAILHIHDLNILFPMNLEMEGEWGKVGMLSILISSRHAQNNNWSKEKELKYIPIPNGQYWGKLFKSHITEQSSLRSEA